MEDFQVEGTQEVSFNLLGEVVSEADLEASDFEEAEVLRIMRHIHGWRAMHAHSVNDESTLTSDFTEEVLHFDADNVWIDDAGSENYIDSDGDVMLAAYRFIREDYEMCYPALRTYLELDGGTVVNNAEES